MSRDMRIDMAKALPSAIQSFLNDHMQLSWGRFLGDPVPKRYAAWARWWFRLVFVHLPIRIAVLPGDLSQHDYHHRNPASRDWPIATYARSRNIEQNRHSIPYRDIWSLANAIDTVFEGLSHAKAITGVEPFDKDIVLGM